MPNHNKNQSVPSVYMQLDGGGTISSDADCPDGTNCLYIGTAGNLSATMAGGTITSMPVQAGYVYGRFETVLSAGSTVSDVWAGKV